MRRPPNGRGAPGGSAPSSSKHSNGKQQLPEHTRTARRPSRCQPGLIPIGPIAAEIVADLRFRRQVLRLHRLGPRAMAELLAEIGAERSITTIIDQKLDTYTELDPETLEVTGGNDFWQPPLHGVER